MSGNGAAVSPLRAALLVACCLPLLSAAAGESRWDTSRWDTSRWDTSRARRSGQPQLFQLAPRTYLACMLVPDGGGGDGAALSGEPTRLSERIASRRRPSSGTRRPSAVRPSERCPSGVTYFDGCNSCSCGTDQLCTLKACNAANRVRIFDPCERVTCGYHQRCQAICVGQVCQLKPFCVSDDSPDCMNCPWLCVDERVNCSDNFGERPCKPTLACYKPNVN